MQHKHKILTQTEQNNSKEDNIQHHNQTKQQQIEQINLKKHSKAELMIGLVTNQIQDQIQHNTIQISQSTKPFNISEIHQLNRSQRSDEKKISQIVKKRRNLQEQMTRLKFEQQQQKIKSRSNSPLDHIKTFRSQYSQKQKLQISRIKKQTQQFQSRLTDKNKQIQKLAILQRKRQLQQRKQYIQKLKEKKKQDIQKNLSKLKQIQEQRTYKIHQQNKKLQKIKKQKVLHQKIQEYHHQIQTLRKNKQKQILNAKRKQMLTDFDAIKQHSKKYYQAIQAEKAQIQRLLAEKLQKQKQRKKEQMHRPSKFLQTIFLEKKRKQQEQIQKVNKFKQMYSRKNSYQQKLRELHKQLIKPVQKKPKQKSPAQINSQSRRLKSKSLSAVDIYRLGNQNMKKIHQTIAPQMVQSHKEQLLSHLSFRSTSRPQYPNYLLASKLKRQTFMKSQPKFNNPQILQLRELKHVMQKNNDREYKFYQVKNIAKKLDQRAKQGNLKGIVDSIAAKIKIIQEFS